MSTRTDNYASFYPGHHHILVISFAPKRGFRCKNLPRGGIHTSYIHLGVDPDRDHPFCGKVQPDAHDNN